MSLVDSVGVRDRLALRAAVLLGIAISALTVTLLDATPALATTATFNTQGCQTWSIPTGISSVNIQATGSAGETINNETALGGTGDVVSGTLSGLSAGQSLDVCVKLGGGAGGGWATIDAHGGYGGGASGVARGNELWPDFSNPVLIAAGGGGGALNGQNGGSAGLPNGGAGADDRSTVGSGGGGGTQTAGGAAGRSGCSACGAGGVGGAPFPLTWGGQGGYSSYVNVGGGGGGGGYYGGGGGGADPNEAGGGGGGGSDFCASSLTGATLTGCGVTGANSSFGTASVSISYTVVTPSSLCLLTKQDVEGSAKFKNLPPALKNAVDKLVTATCTPLDKIVAGLTPAQKATLIAAYDKAVDFLAATGWLTPSQASTLKALAATL